MTMHEYDIEIGDYVDDALPRERVAAVEAHLASCERCRALAADFATLHAAAGGLDRRNPPPQVWTRVAAAAAASERGASGWRRWAPAPWGPALAAGLLLVLVTAGTWLAVRDPSSDGPSGPASATATSAPSAGQSESQEFAEMRDSISHLEANVDPDMLPGETKAAFEGASAATDDVIVRANAVLQDEPYNQMAQQSLFEALRSKLTLLQDMLELINQMRKGNQEETARIVSEMEP
jgi:hypothetical protein